MLTNNYGDSCIIAASGQGNVSSIDLWKTSCLRGRRGHLEIISAACDFLAYLSRHAILPGKPVFHVVSVEPQVTQLVRNSRRFLEGGSDSAANVVGGEVAFLRLITNDTHT